MEKRLKNKKPGARVVIRKVTIAINPKDGWKDQKDVTGRIVEKGDLKFHYYQCNGGYTNLRRIIVEDDIWPGYAIQMDNGITDAGGFNTIIAREGELRFVDFLSKSVRIIPLREYNKAKKLIQKYQEQQKLLK